MNQDHASWTGDTLTAVQYFALNHGVPRTSIFKAATLADAHYWVAADGQCYPLRAETSPTCLTACKDAVRLAGAKNVHVSTPYGKQGLARAASWTRWSAKWGRRTTIAKGGQS